MFSRGIEFDRCAVISEYKIWLYVSTNIIHFNEERHAMTAREKCGVGPHAEIGHSPISSVLDRVPLPLLEGFWPLLLHFLQPMHPITSACQLSIFYSRTYIFIGDLRTSHY